MIYVMSDIHGNFQGFTKMLDKINFNKEKDHLYILGDVVDSGKDSIKLLLHVMEGVKLGYYSMLIGNHDIYLRNFLKDYRKHDRGQPFYDNIAYDLHEFWIYRNKGQSTLEDLKNHLDKVDEIYNFLCNLPYQFDIKVNGQDFLLVHSKPMPTIPIRLVSSYMSDEEYATFSRQKPNEDPMGYNSDEKYNNHIVIFGHTVVDNFESFDELGRCRIYKNIENRQINVDCGSKVHSFYSIDPIEYGKYRLACLCLDTMEEFYIDNSSLKRNY